MLKQNSKSLKLHNDINPNLYEQKEIIKNWEGSGQLGEEENYNTYLPRKD